MIPPFLAGLLMLCPILCGAKEFGHGAHRHGASDGATNDPSAPDHCPEDGDNCICQGAVQLDEVRTPDQNFDALGVPTLLDLSFPTPQHPIAHLTWGGSPTGLAGWGDATAVRSFLQNFRC